MSDYAIIFQVLGAVVALFVIFLTYMSTKTWRWVHVTFMFLVFVASFTFCIYAAMVLKTREGFAAIRRVLLDVMRSYGFGRRQVFWKLLVPAAVPTLANGVRLALVFALINVVGVEFLVNFGGLGQLIADLSDRYELPVTVPGRDRDPDPDDLWLDDENPRTTRANGDLRLEGGIRTTAIHGEITVQLEV